MLVEPREVQVLTLQECSQVADAVESLRTHWVHRSTDLPFYTLGAASYLDGATSACYRARATACNTVLWSSLEWLYRRVIDALEGVLEAPVAYAEDLGLPGFHVFLAHPLFCLPIATVHCDLQYELHEWAYPPTEVDLSNPLSFTLPLELPASGSGLNTWPLDRAEIGNLDAVEVDARLGRSTCQYHPYRLGHMLMHSGHTVHQMAPTENMEPPDRRITLQGHGLRCAGTWRLYW